MRRQITGSVRAGETVTRVAERLLDIDKPIVRLPRHVAELRDAARMALQQGDQNHYLRAVDKWRSTVERLGQGATGKAGEYSIRSATQQLVKDLGTAKVEQLDEIVDRWVVERARYQARMVARSEAAEAFREVYKETNSKQPYVVGYRWTPSGSHPRPDVCDVLASQDLDGLGAGGYKAGNTPTTPHPHCLCTLVAIVDSAHFKRELAKAKGAEEPAKPWESGKRETGQDWVARQPEAYQRRLLGPTRFAAMKAGQHVIDQKGRLKPVHEVTGGPKRPLRLGPAVPAAPAIRRDRLGQVRPFPKVPPVPAGAPPTPPAAPPGSRRRQSAPLRPRASREAARQQAEAKRLQTPQHWLDTEFHAKYGADAGLPVAYGKAVEYRGRALDARAAERQLSLLERGGVRIPKRLGKSPFEAAKTLAGREFKTFGEAIDYFEQDGNAPMLVDQLRASAALAGHRKAITRRTQPIQLQRPRILKGAKTTERAVRRSMSRARAVFSRMADKSLTHPEHTDFFADHDLRGYHSAGRINVGCKGKVETVTHEWGHALDHLNPKLNRRAFEYLRRRTDGEKPVSLKVLTGDASYKDAELTRPDEFFDPYMGKQYANTTEVTSMLVEQLVTNEGLEKLYARDRDSFYFLLGQLSGQ